MTIARAVGVLAVLLLAACGRTQELACGPALPPIATSAPTVTLGEAPPPGFRPSVGVPAPAAVPVAATALPRAVPPPGPHPLDNMAAIAGR